MHDEFLCHVTAYGICGGRRVGVPLGTYRAPTLALALWWLRDRAMWMADRLDPRPGLSHLPEGALTPMADDAPDVPEQLRTWCADADQQENIAEELASGRLVRIVTRDDTTEYELLAESVDAVRMARTQPRRRGPRRRMTVTNSH
ncbi:hypothetical protein [Streptomyces fractus]|uniref:hypothetical protein n=1 Tax=Streptomyces fractus TaxID=641806 RepID=UPI003CF6DD2D